MTTVSAPSSTQSIVLIGNPNTGKTTLFNALTGLRHRVGNYAGVTVETKTGTAKVDGGTLQVIDVPGTYSLSPRSPDEMLAVDILLGNRDDVARPDVIVCIVDASNIDRNLYLASQVFELGVPVVVALNMIDVADARGIKVNIAELEQSLGVRVVAVQANAKRGISELTATIVEAAGGDPPRLRPEFPEPFQNEVTALQEVNDEIAPYIVERALIDVGGHCEQLLAEKTGASIRGQISAARDRLKDAGCAVPGIEARTRYQWIANAVANAVARPTERKVTISDRIDQIVLNRFFGPLIFLALMAVVFQSIYSWAGPFMDLIDAIFGSLSEAVAAKMPEGALRGLIVDGVIAGVGGVLIFLPQIVILFGFIAVLEDCGYMARAAFLMDKLMARRGLSGKSFIPLLSSFACAIPGVMAARTIEDRRDRLTTILVAPLMSCSARLPVYVVLIGAFIPSTTLLGFWNLQSAVLLGMYLIGIIVAPLVAWILKRTIIRGDTPVFLMELPSYKMPAIGMVLYRMIDRGFAFVKRAGTIILATTIVIWAAQYYPRSDTISAEFDAKIAEAESSINDAEQREEAVTLLEQQLAAEYQEQSYLGRIGKAIEPAVEPLGWDWRIGMAAVASFPAREVIIAALGTIYSVGNEVDEESVSLRDAMKASTWPDGRPVYSPVVALSIMVFFALCCQCAATLAVIKRETNTWRWPIFTFVYMTGLAYIAALAVYQIGSRLG